MSKENKSMFFYCDESLFKIEGKSHVLIGTFHPKDLSDPFEFINNLRRDLNLSFFDELKWNTNKFDRIKRNEITVRFLSMEFPWDGFISLSETKNKNYAFEKTIEQIEDFIKENKIPYYYLFIDKDLTTKSNILKLIKSKQIKNCLGYDFVDSESNSVIQLADLFTGTFKFLIEILYGIRKDPLIEKKEEWGWDEGLIKFSWLVKVAFRYKLWGKTYPSKNEPAFVWKNIIGKGIRIESSLSKKIRNKINSFFGKIWLGCTH
jgi:hypothetical protein